MTRKATIPFAEGLSVPREIATSKTAVLAATGAGKSNVGAVLAEELFDASIPFAFICPKGDSWGLGSKGPGGPGLPIAIFGGLYGDVPLEEGSAEPLATFIAEKGVSSVVDVSEFPSDAARTRFLTRFAQALYRKNRTPIHLILDEAHDYLPQRPVRPEHPLCLHAWEKLVKWGRTKGIGVTLISQRSASLNKEVLTQVETLVVLRTSGPRDRKAIREWLEEKELSAELVASLPKLQTGEAWIWSPHFLSLEEPQRVRFRRRRTFDSGSTPNLGERKRVPTRADIDLGALREQFRGEIEKAEAEDPRAFKAKLAEQTKKIALLEGKLQAATERAQVSVVSSDDRAERAVEELARSLGPIRELLKLLEDPELTSARESFEEMARDLTELAERVKANTDTMLFGASDILKRVLGLLDDAEKRAKLAPGAAPRRRADLEAHSTSRQVAPPAPRRRETDDASNGEIKKGARLMVAVLCHYHPRRIRRRLLGTLSGLPSKGSTFSVYLSALRKGGYVDEDEDGLGLTAAGVELASAEGRRFSSDDLRPEVLLAPYDRKLKAGARAMIRHLVSRYPEAVSRNDLGEAVELPHTGSTFSVYLSALRRQELVDEEKGVGLRASAELMAWYS